MTAATMRFENTGERFSALRQAQEWCRDNGYSMGTMQRGAPMGVKRGDCIISKWRHMDEATRQLMDGQVHGQGTSFRNGWVEIRIDDDCDDSDISDADLICQLRIENQRLMSLIHNPHTDDFLNAVRIEAAHQRELHGEHDQAKTAEDWFWTVGYLAGKAIRPSGGKRLHHIITTAAVCLNWHRLATTEEG